MTAITFAKDTIKTAPGKSLLAFACLLLVLVVSISFCIGRYPIAPGDLFLFTVTAFGGHALPSDRYALIHSIFVGSRLPRIAGAAIIGASLAVAGTTYQAVFRNPLISPDLVGVLSGAGFGAALGIVYDTGPFGMQVLAFLGGISAVAISVTVARSFESRSMLMLVFGGLVSTALFTALLSILKYIADPERQLPDIVFWLLGSLTQIQLRQLPLLAGALALGLFVLSTLGRMLDALSMGDDEARTLGVPVEALRLGAIAIATILAALTVSAAGMIGWLGLIVPHIARLMGGPSNGRLLPLAACYGAIFLLICDDLARTLSEEEIPVGILVDLFGVLIFLAVLRFLRRGWA
ncbi:FecCD family ABC transporter permease [Beijerinckia indica]|uniref:Transport system permease protein n=1 Tax=Beijerinckia indica subsp. indica (strain ATCC 9039 / DSM 1715 / NCIMB 8712) TaxID=395963 RepID=B2IF63_BEII9|nr:iron ABC transporter permease [Beijerinckia indica]ACB95628.1 transport system permease protein [Beijerinckia indica subsp. indica ATCC 9039]